MLMLLRALIEIFLVCFYFHSSHKQLALYLLRSALYMAWQTSQAPFLLVMRDSLECLCPLMQEIYLSSFFSALKRISL